MSVWTTREGVSIKISEMTDFHLINAIRYLEREGKDVISHGFISCGEDPYYDEEPNPIYEALIEEAERRELL